MRRRSRAAVRSVAGRLLGERAVPIGAIARDRRLLRRALRGHSVGRVLVLGPGLAARQAWPDARVDVAGTSPYSPEVTICSEAVGGGSLPTARWDTVIISAAQDDLSEQLAAIQAACRPSARLLLLDHQGWDERTPEIRALADAASISCVLGKGRQRAWLAETRP